MKTKVSTVKVPQELKAAIDIILEKEYLPLYLFENWAIERFLNDGGEVKPRYLIRKYNDQYIKREKVISLHLVEELSDRVKAHAKEIHATNSCIILQALENECLRRAKILNIPINISYLCDDEH